MEGRLTGPSTGLDDRKEDPHRNALMGQFRQTPIVCRIVYVMTLASAVFPCVCQIAGVLMPTFRFSILLSQSPLGFFSFGMDAYAHLGRRQCAADAKAPTTTVMVDAGIVGGDGAGVSPVAVEAVALLGGGCAESIEQNSRGLQDQAGDDGDRLADLQFRIAVGTPMRPSSAKFAS